jgi:hypothetical protein
MTELVEAMTDRMEERFVQLGFQINKHVYLEASCVSMTLKIGTETSKQGGWAVWRAVIDVYKTHMRIWTGADKPPFKITFSDIQNPAFDPEALIDACVELIDIDG